MSTHSLYKSNHHKFPDYNNFLHYTGDDCISIQTGCSNIYIHDVDCGPGHGISIGGLGKEKTKACVSNITVRDVTMHETTNGVRIKSWQVNSPTQVFAYQNRGKDN